MRTPFTIIVLAAAATQLGATDCGGGITRDPGFDLWCGAELCTWKVERGEIKRVATWHEGDAGVELIGSDTAIAQMTPVDSGDATCIRFDLIANVDEDSEVRLDVDVFGDGTIDLSERMPTSHWQPLSYKIAIKAPYQGVRFVISKRGTGKAVVAQIQAETAPNECEGLSIVDGGPAPLGTRCLVDTDCGSGLCRTVADPTSWFGVAQLCVGCDPAASTCGGGEVCGLEEPTLAVRSVPIACVPPAARELGEQCIASSECASNICTEGVCSTCTVGTCGTEDCHLTYPHGPYVCSPLQHRRGATEPCVANEDCQSNQCNGAARMQCHDGRACDSPMDCPVESGLEPGPCENVGIQGGRCQ